MLYFHSIQSLSCVRFFLTPWTAAHQAFLSITNSWSLPKLMSIKTVMPSNHLIICHPLFLLPSMFPRIRVFSNESVLHIRWPKYFTQVFQSPSNDNSGLISFRFDCFDFLEVQGILKSLLQHHSSKASVLWHSAFFMVQISHSYISSVQSVSHVWLFVTLWTEAHQTSLPITNSWSLPKLMCIESVMPSNHLILCCPPLLPPSVFPRIRVFSNESVLHIRWAKYWSFSFSISPSDKYSGLISFRIDWLDLLAGQRTLKNLLQHHSSKASILWPSAFFMVQLSYPSMTTGKP